MTNADVIRQMTDDELYRFLGAFEVGDIDYALTSCNWCGEEIDCATCFRRWLFSDANDYKGLLADKGINSGYTDRKTEPLKGSERLLKGSEQTDLVEDSPSLVKDLVKAFGEDGTWLERQGVYTLTLAEAKQRAVDIIESVLAKDEPTISKMEQVEDEPQTCSVNGRPYDRGNCEYFRCTADEPQTDKGIGCSRCEGRFDCYDRDMPHAVCCNNYGKVTDGKE